MYSMGLGPNTDQPLSDYHSDGKQKFCKKNCKKFAKNNIFWGKTDCSKALKLPTVL